MHTDITTFIIEPVQKVFYHLNRINFQHIFPTNTTVKKLNRVEHFPRQHLTISIRMFNCSKENCDECGINGFLNFHSDFTILRTYRKWFVLFLSILCDFDIGLCCCLIRRLNVKFIRWKHTYGPILCGSHFKKIASAHRVMWTSECEYIRDAGKHSSIFQFHFAIVLVSMNVYVGRSQQNGKMPQKGEKKEEKDEKIPKRKWIHCVIGMVPMQMWAQAYKLI